MSKLTPQAEEAYREDMALRLKEDFKKEEKRQYHLRHIFDEQESSIPDHIDRTPRPDNFHGKVKITPAFIVGFAKTAFKQLTP